MRCVSLTNCSRTVTNQFFIGSIYVASFSADPDVLSQWRAYASDGLGYAVGFSSAAQLVPKEHPEWYQPPRLRKVVYEQENQGAILRPVVAECLRLLDGLAAEPPTAIEEAMAVARGTVAALVSELYAVIKNPGFAQENEWRCVFWNHAPGGYLEPLKFRSTRFGVTPYVELGWTDESGYPVKPPIKRLVLGPRLPKESEGAAYMLLLSNGYSAGCGELEAEIARSRVSYR